MKPISSTRLRFVLLLCGVAVLVLAVGGIARRREAVRILEEASAGVDLDCSWESPWMSAETTWWRRLPNARITFVRVNHLERRGAELGRAVRICGELDRLDIGFSGTPEGIRELKDFLHALGRQPTVQRLTIEGSRRSREAGPDDLEIVQLLQQFPQLQSLSLSGLDYSGANFPPLKSLTSLTFDHMPISEAGFAEILRCPALKTLGIGPGAEMSAVAVMRVSELRPKALRRLDLHLTGLQTPGDSDVLAAWLGTVCPGLECHIEGPVPAHEELVDPPE